MPDKWYGNLADMPLVLTVTEVATVLGVGRHAVYDLVHSGESPVIHIGRHILIYRETLGKFLKQN